MPGEDDFDAPDGGGGVAAAPCELGRDDVGWIDRAVYGYIDGKRRIGRRCNRIHRNRSEVGGNELGIYRRCRCRLGRVARSPGHYFSSQGGAGSKQDSRGHQKLPFHRFSPVAASDSKSGAVPWTCLKEEVRRFPGVQITCVHGSKADEHSPTEKYAGFACLSPGGADSPHSGTIASICRCIQNPGFSA